MKALRSFRKMKRGALFFLAMMFATSGLFRIADGAGRAIAAGSLQVGSVHGMAAAQGAAPPMETAGDTAVSPGTVTPASAPSPAAADGAQRPLISAADTAAIADLLGVLKAREAALAQREAEMDARAEQLKAAEQMINENLSALEEAESSLKHTLALADGAMERDIGQLTKVYETMKPKDAAILFETMDPNFAAGFLARMKPAAAAGVMAGLSPETSYSISIILAGRNRDVPVQ